MNDFSESSLRTLLEAIQDRASSFIDHLTPSGLPTAMSRPIYLRFDIDNDFRKAYQMACICNEYGIRGTFFILNTAPYWNDPEIWPFLRVMQSKGHEIGWHNNLLTECIEMPTGMRRNETDAYNFIVSGLTHIMSRFKDNSISIIGSASHGDPLCRKLNYLNYEVFTECPRTEEAANFPACKFAIPKVSMHSFGLEYEAYHVPYDLYLSESGGKQWTIRKTGRFDCYWHPKESSQITQEINQHDRIQILIHPQHWKI